MKHTYKINRDKMEFREVYCSNCKKILGRYNVKFYTEDKIGELINTSHSTHIRNGHQVNIRKFEKIK
ncbi:MAG: hypothetical protein OEY54_05380 [Nitrosopumilus sp.]|nr:hypothetical protein [Nitrosopumilus sp.]